MARDVFGKPVNEGSRLERAVMAQQDPNAGNKRDEAIAYVRKQKADSGNGVSTLCIFYNATGATMLFDPEDSNDGEPWNIYPTEVQNGQWGAFLHVKNAPVPSIVPSASMAYVIYRCEGNNNSGYCMSLIGWETPWNFGVSNYTHAFCDVFDDEEIYDKNEIYRKVHASDRLHTVRKKGMWITTTTESDSSPLFEAHFKLEDALDSQYQTMASNVFGKPITEGSRLRRAVMALEDPNADNKRNEAIAYVRKQKEDSGNVVSTLCIFYNATGASLLYDQGNSLHGEPWNIYPAEVQNGQWGAFLHVKSAPVPNIVPNGSVAYVIYCVKGNNKASFCSSLIGWHTPCNFQASNDTHAFCEVYDDGTIDDKDEIFRKIRESDRLHTARNYGMSMTTTIESDTSPLFEARFNLEDALVSQ